MSRFHRCVSGLTASLAFALPLPAAETAGDPAAALERAIAAAEARLGANDRAGADAFYRRALFEGWLVRMSLERLAKRTSSARDALEKAASYAPQEPAALRSLATAQLQMGDAAAAGVVLARLAARDAKDVETRRLLAKAQAAQGNLGQAALTLDDAAALAADDPEALFLLAAEHLWQKRPEAAARLFARIVEARPLPQTHVLIGRAYRDAGEYDRAAASLQAALAQDARARRAHYYLGMVLLADARLGPERLPRAIGALRGELEVAPGDPLASDQLGSALMEAGQPAEALPAFEAASRDERFLYVFHLGRCQLALDRPKDAVESLRRALALAGEQGASESDLEKMHYQLGLGLRKLGAGEEAAAHLADARRLASASAAEPATVGPSDTSPLAELTRTQRDALVARVDAGLARSYFNLGLVAMQGASDADAFAAAAARLESAAAIDPAFPRVQSALGVAYFNARRFADAAGALARALEAEPDDAGTRRMLALSWINVEAWDKAVPLLREDPEREKSASLQLAYGVALARTGRAAEAVAPLEAAARLAPEQADVQLELFRAYDGLGRSELARRSFEAFQRLKDRQPGSAP